MDSEDKRGEVRGEDGEGIDPVLSDFTLLGDGIMQMFDAQLSLIVLFNVEKGQRHDGKGGSE